MLVGDDPLQPETSSLQSALFVGTHGNAPDNQSKHDALIPQPLLPKWEKRSQILRIKVPLPGLGEGFRVRVCRGCVYTDRSILIDGCQFFFKITLSEIF
ncbi:MAG: hypothetical protein EAZ61_03325 [Oscillatoriales cyanobacterium]|nr:MAG: hypothetical protein EAZ61_03325 [Oscillatoriales cyanobacterium]